MKHKFIHNLQGGYYDARGLTVAPPENSIAAESFNWVYGEDGALRLCNGVRRKTPTFPADVAMLFGDGYASIGQGQGTSGGNVSKYVGGAAVFTSNDLLHIFDPSITTTVQYLLKTWPDFIPQIAPRDVNSSTRPYRLPVTIGIPAPEFAPELILSDETGTNNGIYAQKVSYVRGFTGEESLTSPASNTVKAGNSKITTRYPLPPVTRYIDNSPIEWDTNDFWFTYTTPKDFGNTTVYFKLETTPERRIAVETYTTSVYTQVGTTFTLTSAVAGVNPVTQFSYLFTVPVLKEQLVGKTLTDGIVSAVIVDVTALNVLILDSAPVFTGATLTIHSAATGLTVDRYITREWSENDLLSESPPEDLFPLNTQAKFFVPLNNLMVAVGTADDPLGTVKTFTGVAVSQQNFFHAFPPQFRFNLPETPVGVSYRAEDGYFYVLCQNSIHEIRWTGAVDTTPVVLRTISTSVGVASQDASYAVDGILYFVTPQGRIGRLSGSGETDFNFSVPVQQFVNTWIPANATVSYDSKLNAVLFTHNGEGIYYYIAENKWSSPVAFYSYFFASGVSVFAPTDVINTALSFKGVPHIWTAGNLLVSTATLLSSGGANRHILTGLFPGIEAGDEVHVYDITNTTLLAVTYVTTVNPILFQANLDPTTLGGLTVGNTYTFRVFNGAHTWEVDRQSDGTPIVGFALDSALRTQFSHLGVGVFAKTVTRARLLGKFPVNVLNPPGSSSGFVQMFGDFNFTLPLRGMPPGGVPITNISGNNHWQRLLLMNAGSARMIQSEVRLTNVATQTTGFDLLEVDFRTSKIDADYTPQ